MQAFTKYVIFSSVFNPGIFGSSIRRMSMTSHFSTRRRYSHNSTPSKSQIDNIVELLKNLENIGILDKRLHNEIRRHIQQNNTVISDGDDGMIGACYKDLLPLTDLKAHLIHNEDSKVKYLSEDVLDTMKDKNYSILALLVKLKLIYSHFLTDDNLLSDGCEKTLEEQMYSPEQKEENLLNELLNAPLNDIEHFLKESGKNFDAFYTIENVNGLKHRISHPVVDSSIQAQCVIDEICEYINNSLTKKYSPLTSTEIVTYIADQYCSEVTFQYRYLLQKFIESKPEKFTLANFYRVAKIQPIFSAELEKRLENLFKHYCDMVSQALQTVQYKQEDIRQQSVEHSSYDNDSVNSESQSGNGDGYQHDLWRDPPRRIFLLSRFYSLYHCIASNQPVFYSQRKANWLIEIIFSYKTVSTCFTCIRNNMLMTVSLAVVSNEICVYLLEVQTVELLQTESI
ncbi:unnamed protein product [Adineta ricciae]|uniref:Uncharacterized protein n=1 Tax=Adineta ricciae TaxID=249248 RepID=A0A814SN25_ADIRI|nr:unnamed protein product [Adineta ricciae]